MKHPMQYRPFTAADGEIYAVEQELAGLLVELRTALEAGGKTGNARIDNMTSFLRVLDADAPSLYASAFEVADSLAINLMRPANGPEPAAPVIAEIAELAGRSETDTRKKFEFNSAAGEQRLAALERIGTLLPARLKSEEFGRKIMEQASYFADVFCENCQTMEISEWIQSPAEIPENLFA